MHYLVFVLVPGVVGKPDIPLFVAIMLERYNANLPIMGGVYPTNPRAEWDYWSIGGRWDGMVSGQSGDGTVRGYGKGLESKWARNTLKVSDLSPDAVPAVIITPDGNWHNNCTDVKRFIDWSDRERKWDQKARVILDQHRECVIVAIDYHSW